MHHAVLSPNRRMVVAGLSLLASPALAKAKPCPPPRVLFVCPAGTVKSAIAREYLKRTAAKQGVAVQVQSRGVHPEDHVSPELAVRLRAEGIDPAAEPLRSLAPADITGADIVIAFDEAAQAPGMSAARSWSIPSWNSDFERAKAALLVQIEALLGELRDRGCAT